VQAFCYACGRSTTECQGCARELDPPRFCKACGRRLTVVVTPTGFIARCKQHGFVDRLGPVDTPVTP